jgi:oxidoreductase
MVAQGKALVTGAAGFIGGHLAQRLLEQGWGVRLLVKNGQSLAAALSQRCELVTADLSVAAGLAEAVRDVDVIFHCAANVRTWDRWDAYQRDNVSAVANLLDAIARENRRLSRLVHFSSVDVYGFPLTPCDEESRPDGGEFGYSRSKWQGEQLVAERCARESIPYTILRPANVFGPGGQFVSRIGEALASGLMLTVDGGRVNAGMIYIDNLLDYVLWAASAGQAAGRCYNVRDAYDLSWAEFVSRLRRGIHGRGRVLDLPFGIADLLARFCEGFYRIFLPSREPLLHRLLVRQFGRSCGHSAVRIRSDSGLVGRIGLDEAMDRSVRSFLAARASR